MPQSHEPGNRERSRRRFGEQTDDCLYFLQAVGIGFLGLRGSRINGSIAGWVLPLEIVLLLCQGESAADRALDVLQRVAAQFGRSDLIQPSLDVVGSSILQPNLSAERLKVIFPDISIPLHCGWALVQFDPRQIDALYEIANRNDAICWNRPAFDCCHVPLGFGHDVGRRALAACRDRAELMCYSLPFDGTADIAPFPVAHIPAITDADYLPFLLASPHLAVPLSLLLCSFAFAGSNGFLCDLTTSCSGETLSPCLSALAGDLRDFGSGILFCACLCAETA